MATAERVLLTTDAVGGVWTFTLELARGLKEKGVQVGLASMGGAPGPGRKNAVEGLGVELYPSAFKLEWMPEPWEDVRQASAWLLDLAARFQPDVVHLNQYSFGHLPFSAPVLITGHSCVLSWWRAVHGCDAPAEWSRYRYHVARGLHAAALVAAPSHTMLAALETHYGPFPRTQVIPNGRDLPAAQRVTKQPFVFAAGRFWDIAKNLQDLERIASQLPWPVYVAGDLDHPDGTRRASSTCRVLGKLSPRQVAWWMERASIYALPARYEPFGLSLVEAALNGCALVLGDIPSLREIWGDAAVFVPPGDTEALREAVTGLIRVPEDRIEMARRARMHAHNFNASRMTDAYLAAYRSLTEPASAGHLTA
ncbi:MAG TPA: glycosyltransferase family 4 protein [Bryobacteraceae bacterium]|nr:glycosyltransferase family 4 protein [Bryobacteraceae bacterium]